MLTDELDPDDDDELGPCMVTCFGIHAGQHVSGSRSTFFGPRRMFYDLTHPATERHEQVWTVNLAAIPPR